MQSSGLLGQIVREHLDFSALNLTNSQVKFTIELFAGLSRFDSNIFRSHKILFIHEFNSNTIVCVNFNGTCNKTHRMQKV